MKEKINTELVLLDNAYNFIIESLVQYGKAKTDPKKWPFAIFMLIQGLELLIKQVLKNEHPLFIFENIDKPKNTVTITQALDRLSSISKIKLDEKELRLIKKSIHYRNQILHYEISFNNREFKVIYSQLFEFVHYFHRKHLINELHNAIPEKLWKVEADLISYFKNQFIYYNGIEVNKLTPQEIIEFQKFDGILVDDIVYKRIRYGDEEFANPNSKVCHDCGCLRGQFHTEGCDVEQCPICEGQFLGCSCMGDVDVYHVRLKDYQKNNKA